MKDTMALFQEDEFSDKDLEKLSEALDKAYFEPISELLEGILVTIAGN
jgi:vacuolar-type H+-ATPase subunit C/Vma6